MNISRAYAFTLAALLLTGCVVPPDPDGPEESPEQPQAEPPPDAPPGEEAATDAEQPEPPAVTQTEPTGLPSVDLADGPTVTVSGRVEGTTSGQVDFIVAAPDGFRIVHVAPIERGRYSTRFPANYPDPLYLNAVSYEEGGTPTPDAPAGGTTEPVSIGATDLTIALDVGVPDVLREVFGVDPTQAAPPE